MKRSLILFALFACAALTACKEEPIPGHQYDGPSYVYFTEPDYSYSWSWIRRDQNEEYTFSSLKVSIVGHVVDYEREVEMEVIQPENYDLPPAEMFKLNNIVIPAGESTGYVSVTFYKDHDYFRANRGMRWAFYARLKNNEDFEIWHGDDAATQLLINLEIHNEYR